GVFFVGRRRLQRRRRAGGRGDGQENQQTDEGVFHGVGFAAGWICAFSGEAGEQPLPRAVAGTSKPQASFAIEGLTLVDEITQFWLWRTFAKERPKLRAAPSGVRATLYVDDRTTTAAVPGAYGTKLKP